MSRLTIVALAVLFTLSGGCQAPNDDHAEAQLVRVPYQSTFDQSDREYFVYLPKGYHEDDTTKWPVMLFLHGNGERGNGKNELDYTLAHGPIYEAWVQKRDLPFIIIGPQLHMHGRDSVIGYLKNRSPENYLKRLATGVPEREADFATTVHMSGRPADENYPYESYGPVVGWETVEQDLIDMLDQTLKNYKTDKSRVYLSGLSYGGFGTWYLGSKHPDRFAAINPIVGWGHKELMKPLAEHRMPIWCYAGGRDLVIQKQYFYPGLNELERLGHMARFTIEADMGHDVWKRVYAGQDIYDWLLSHRK
ncbi:prolyl oligopeptidase family serine peptidase [Reichenbachiella carrageenanivorans]|uniref:Prolyl oligopeptidase family serine peptidase n=1 Tax=Reichenbachiella carrageenanivorans TaxID=2979869 RepID=A0ABY6D4D6_9BACT|nr:prolyl oligopeptidase family serine peptidase [Reichenbachiella carrageenanivorans]UXX81017.1 prolyl oligopeptidase family serine peptidase [Reichenbachiella carrageenanivorans]